MKQHNDYTEIEKIFRAFESIEFDEKDKRDVYANIKNNIEKNSGEKRFIKWSNYIMSTAIVAIFFIVGGYLFTHQFILNQAHPSPQDKHLETIQTYLENEFTGPSEELTDILDKGLYSFELDAYLEQNYGDLAADMEKMIKGNYVLSFLRSAHLGGYQLNPKNIDIQKIKGTRNNVYQFKVEVEYSKNGQTNTTAVTGVLNLDEHGRILFIRNMDDGGLFEQLKN
ncbi:MAG: hypothetical protein H0Z32_12490 [Bacillaceae bacterium]|nr:hypothetical protein [Bacillaceae bacterium]